MMPMMSSMAPFHLLGQDNQNEMQHDYLVKSCHWHQHQYHVMPVAPSMAQLHLFSQDDEKEVQHWHWCGHDVMHMAKMAALHSLGQDNRHKMQLDFLVILCHWHCHQCHIMPTVSSMASLHSVY